MPAYRWAMWCVSMLACSLCVLQAPSAWAQSYVNPQLNGDYNCDFAERVVAGTNYDIRQQTWYPESNLNHRLNPGSGGLVQDFLAKCTGLNGFSFGFTLPSIEDILNALLAAFINAACSAARQAVSRVTSLFPSVPCYNGCGFGSIPLSDPGTPMAAGAAQAAQAASSQASPSPASPSQQWDTVRSLFEVPAAPAPATTSGGDAQ